VFENVTPTCFVSTAARRFARPGLAFCSCTTIGVPVRFAAMYAGAAAYPPTPSTTSISRSRMIASVRRTADQNAPGNRSAARFSFRGKGSRGMVSSS
jgi:hypothetical protein